MKINKLEILNYRSINSLKLDFPNFYTAICGKNNAGKTNIVRAIQALLPEVGPFSSRFEDEISFKDDFPVWKKKEKLSEEIKISLSVTVDNENDAGLHLFIKKFVTNASDTALNVELSVTKKEDSSDNEVEVKVDGVKVDEFSAIEILKKIRSTSAIFFYNSTELDNVRYKRNRVNFGSIGEFSSSDKEKFDQLQKKLDDSIQNLAKKHQKDITELLGKLEEKYSVALKVPPINLEYVPFQMSLGNKNFSVALEDWGSGTRNRTQILLIILKAKKISETANLSDKITPAIIVEEPESFLHPSAQAEFGRIIQDLAQELNVQVIVTTHSPYMMGLENSTSNILLERCIEKKEVRDTLLVNTEGDEWMKPFGLALGIDNSEFAPWKSVIESKSSKILLVEGDIDKSYFELLRKDEHGSNKLDFDGDIVPYGGKDTLKNTMLLKFVLGRYDKFFITFDLDCENEVKKCLEALSLEKNKQFLPIGINSAGKRDIEGLLPDSIRSSVYSSNPDLVQAAMSSDTKEKNDAKRRIKTLLLETFQADAKFDEEHYKNFYSVAKIIQKALA